LGGTKPGPLAPDFCLMRALSKLSGLGIGLLTLPVTDSR
jgi:hypothetical protein